MGKSKFYVFNFWGFSAVAIVITSYYYIANLTLYGIPKFAEPYASFLGFDTELTSDNDVTSVKYEPKGPIVLHENDYLLLNTERCKFVRHKRAKKVVLFVIVTMSRNYYTRQQLRLSWALPDIEDDVRFESVYVMGVGRSALRDDNMRVWHNEFGELSREMVDYRDMLLVDYIEDYTNISVKLVAGLHYAKHHCHDVDYIMVVHDDVMIRRDWLIPYLWELPSHNFIGGDCADSRKPDRNPNSKFYVGKQEFEHEVYPSFCYGSAVIMTPDIRDKLLAQTAITPYFKRDDVYLGMLMRDANISPVTMPNVRHEVKDMRYCAVKNLLMLQPVPMARQKMLREEHERFEDEGRKCTPEKGSQGGEL
ncbi:beta-1,3-galactosyltransferase 5-like [Symsagittifera roscoffensis]|uniref:beta-1,3-galactosyltransferase 5-like n=1 Tax=Symsagittifera roscoffensis TaxID=84072 RepID=UPI00307C1192